MKLALEDISRELARIGIAGSFASRRTAAAADLILEVRDLGRIWLPVTASTARRLCKVARPARHGFKDETRLDRRVRDTWEISKSQISIDEPRWKRTLLPQLDRICRDLGLPQKCRLKAQLHNMLVYAPGQFFVPHQDSEKTDDMIGTLIVSLPSQFSGGAMVLEHHGETMRIGGSNSCLTFVAFYADCRQEVRPVRQGHRIVLTFNLSIEGNATLTDAPETQIHARLPRCHGRGCRKTQRPESCRNAPSTFRSSWSQAENGTPTREFARVLRQPDIHAQVIEFLVVGAPTLLWYMPLALLQAAHESRKSGALHNLGLKPVHLHCTEEITAGLNVAFRASDDWSIASSIRCSCLLCATLARYLRAHDEVRLEWPLAKSGRAHIHGVIDSHDLPVAHITRRVGSPFTLILEKTAAVFERDAVQRQLQRRALKWLNSTAADF